MKRLIVLLLIIFCSFGIGNCFEIIRNVTSSSGTISSNIVTDNYTTTTVNIGILAINPSRNAQPSIVLGEVASGKHGIKIGAGGSSIPDVNIYRDSADLLKTDDTFLAGSSLIFGGSLLGVNPAGNNTLAGLLRVNNTLEVSGNTIITGNLTVSTNCKIIGNTTVNTLSVNDIVVNNGCIAEMYCSYNAISTDIILQNTYYDVTAGVKLDNETSKNITFSNGVITALVPGLYKVDCSLSFSGGSSDTYNGGFSVNNADPEGDHEFNRKLGTGGDVGSASFHGLKRLNAGDTVRIKIKNTSSTADLKVETMNFTLIKVY